MNNLIFRPDTNFPSSAVKYMTFEHVHVPFKAVDRDQVKQKKSHRARCSIIETFTTRSGVLLKTPAPIHRYIPLCNNPDS